MGFLILSSPNLLLVIPGSLPIYNIGKSTGYRNPTVVSQVGPVTLSTAAFVSFQLLSFLDGLSLIDDLLFIL